MSILGIKQREVPRLEDDSRGSRRIKKEFDVVGRFVLPVHCKPIGRVHIDALAALEDPLHVEVPSVCFKPPALRAIGVDRLDQGVAVVPLDVDSPIGRGTVKRLQKPASGLKQTADEAIGMDVLQAINDHAIICFAQFRPKCNKVLAPSVFP